MSFSCKNTSEKTYFPLSFSAILGNPHALSRHNGKNSQLIHTTKTLPQKESLPLKGAFFVLGDSAFAQKTLVVTERSRSCLFVQLNQFLQVLELGFRGLLVPVEEDFRPFRELAGERAVACLVVEERLVASVTLF